MQAKFIFSLILAVLVAIFAIQNSAAVPVNFIVYHLEISQALIILISARSLSISLEYHCTGTMSWNLLSLKEGRVLFLWTLISVWFTVEILLLFPLDVSMPSNRMILLKWNMKILFFPALVHLILFFPQWLDWHCGKMISVMRDFCQGRYRQLHIHWKWENIMSIRQCLILYVQGKM